MVFGREFRLYGGRLVMPRSRLWMGREILAQDLDVDSQVSFAPYAPRQHPGLSPRLAAGGPAALLASSVVG